MVLSACARALIPAALVLTVALILGAHFPGLLGLLLAALFVAGMAAVAAGWGTMLALRYKSQSAAPLMQSGMFVLILFTAAYAPLDLLQGWLHDVARLNPVTQIVEAVRQGFIGGIGWQDTWQGLVALAALMALMLTAALRGMVRFNN
jgi:ABC-type polysaccharide/polyol phosphate export permease